MKDAGRAIGAIIAMSYLFAAASASAMTVSEFLMRADALKAKGPLAMLQQGEIKVLKTEIQGVAEMYRTDIVQARARGDRSLGCPPPKGKARLSSDELLQSFRTIPTDRQKATSVKTGFYEMMKARYPCT